MSWRDSVESQRSQGRMWPVSEQACNRWWEAQKREVARRKAAKVRQREAGEKYGRGKKLRASAKLAEAKKGKTRDKVAAYAGMGLVLALLVPLTSGCLAAIPVGLATLCCVTVTQKPSAPHGEARSWIPFTVAVHAPRIPTFDELSGRSARPQAEQQHYQPRVEEVSPQHEEETR